MHFILCATLIFVRPAAHTLKKVQYPADGYVLKVIWLHKMMTQVAESEYGYNLSATKNM
jgi:hypothetical protein